MLLLVLVCLYPLVGKAQSLDYTNTKEKVYVQTSHVFFKPGETMFFKIYVVKANTQTPSFMSNVVYTEVISPSGTVVQKLNYGVESGYAEGSFDFSEQAPGGVYKIRAYTTWMRNENENTFFVKEITLLKVIAPRLLMKLDFPEKGYGAGDEVKADFSMRNLNDQPIRNHEATYKVAVDGAVVQTNTFRTDEEGKAQIRFFLPKTITTIDGLLNITIQYDSYTEAISRSIPIVLNKIDLQFMPEGGTLVQGITTQIAFKAINENGKPVDVKGEILDSRGNKAASFESYRFGMGKFMFTPQTDETYTAKIITPANITQAFALPHASRQGIIMNMTNATNQVVVKLSTTNKREVTLVGQSKNTVYYTKKIVLQPGESTLTIDDNKFPAGIACFTLYTNNLPVAERLMFLNENKNLQVSISTGKPKYLPREKVTLTIKTKDEKGNPVPSNLSLAVLDDKLWSFADDKQDHILSWLLMSSELKGKIEEPTFYFKKEEPKAVTALDLVMLTNGYRYFDYTELVEKQGTLSYLPDEQNIVSGIIVNAKQQPVKGTVFLVHCEQGGKAIQYNTTEDGLFFFSQVTQNSQYYLFAHAENKKEKVAIQVTQNGLGYNPIKRKALTEMATVKPGWNIVIPKAEEAPLREVPVDDLAKKDRQVMNFDQLKVNNLQDVVVVGYGTAKKQSLVGSVAIVRANELGPANLGNVLQGRVAGLQIPVAANPMEGTTVKIRGMRSLTNALDPLVVLNGVPMEEFRLNALNPDDIESVTVLKDAAATAIYGSRAAYGVILIETKKLRTGGLRFNMSPTYFYASQPVRIPIGSVLPVARKFYAPKYYTTEPQERTDFRETIYWNPVVQTDKQGMAQVEFYNSDASTTFRAIVEGIGYNGKAGRAEYTYVTQNRMTVDAKIPPYLTVGDKALIPLVIKNNNIQDVQFRIKVLLPPTMVIGDFTNTILLPADSSREIRIPVKAMAATNGKIQFIIETDQKTETITLPVTATEKGFPVIETFSGNKSSKHAFTISKVIPGSIRTSLKIFNSVEGQLLDGIESMLQEPHGCFEQTSSSTYPNIFILKYLRESGKSNPAIEKKARGYIEAGYNRLIGFETAQNGFEWFGKTPPHEALTAYGLLEFTDMQEFIKVDKRMLERTKQFLLSRRDGKGTFTLSTGGYDRFASVPNKIANIYIVYALTQAGIGKEIAAEYEAAVKKALESNDGYQLAMMALAASNMKRENDFKALMNVLNTNFQKNNLSSETSVVNSRDASLRVETVSLYALALMREASPDVAAVANLISKILAEKSYYGYGSTQSTVLALQAIVAYSKLIGRMSENTQINFTMNDTAAVAENDLTTIVREGKNVFSVQYNNSRSAVPYNLEVSYNTFTPPNSAKAELKLATKLATTKTRVGETMRMDIEVTNEKNMMQPMAIAKIGIPAGLSIQPWQLKEIKEKNQIAYYEIFDNYLVLYWMGFAPNETKTIRLDLKADIAGTYKGKASNTYLYYTPEYKNWNDGVEVEIE